MVRFALVVVWFKSDELTWIEYRQIEYKTVGEEGKEVIQFWQLLFTSPLYRFFLLEIVKDDPSPVFDYH